MANNSDFKGWHKESRMQWTCEFCGVTGEANTRMQTIEQHAEDEYHKQNVESFDEKRKKGDVIFCGGILVNGGNVTVEIKFGTVSPQDSSWVARKSLQRAYNDILEHGSIAFKGLFNRSAFLACGDAAATNEQNKKVMQAILIQVHHSMLRVIHYGLNTKNHDDPNFLTVVDGQRFMKNRLVFDCTIRLFHIEGYKKQGEGKDTKYVPRSG